MGLLDSPLGTPPSASEKGLVELAGHIDLLLGGPPCQGHSDLNNHTRRTDAKNQLYERMARFAELVRPMHLIIENVPAVLRDKRKVVDTTVEALRRVGYNLGHGIVELSSLGVPQRRRRHVLVASLTRDVCLESMTSGYHRLAPTVKWAIADLRSNDSGRLFDTPSTPTPRSCERIEYLFNHGCYDLPDSERPDCHRLYEHTYRSVYGRLHWDEPAQTITGGFGCMGQGRFVHPAEERTITPHEAARLQFIPDFFSFDSVSSRTALAQMIGNAVPPKLTYVVALELIR
jgi:DNA (cytosine-5)-methyltransferase 1